MGGSTHAFFGHMDSIPVVEGSVSVIIIVIAVNIVDLIFDHIREVTVDTPFEGMFRAIEQELMVVGIMAFIFKIMLNTTSFLSDDWVWGIEVADVLIPMTSFMFCFQGMWLIILSINQCETWSKAYHLQLFEILDIFYDFVAANGRLLDYKWLKFSSVHSELEFRLYHCIFCEQHNVRKDAFAFDSYVQRVYEKFLLDLMRIEWMDWVIIITFVCINWIRVNYGGEYYSDECTGTQLHYSHTSLSMCEVESSLYIFMIVGYTMLFVFCCVAISTRYIELQIFEMQGIQSIQDLPFFLQTAEKNDDIEGKKRLSAEEIREQISRQRRLEFLNGEKGMITFRKRIPQYFEHKLHHLKHWIKSFFVSKVSRHELVKRHVETFHKKSEDKMGNPISRKSRFSTIHTKVRSTLKTINQDHFINEKTEDDVIDNEIKKIAEEEEKEMAEQLTSNPRLDVRGKSFLQKQRSVLFNKSKASTKRAGLKTKDLSYARAFIFKSPQLYFEIVETMNMITSFYIALWVVNFSSSSKYMTDSVGWTILTVAPGLLSCLIYLYIVNTSALLKAVCIFDVDAVVETMERTEDVVKLGEIMRNKVVNALGDVANPQEELKRMFSEIDDNHSNNLSREEFRAFMTAMGIECSNSRWKTIFREIDRNFDDEISFEEFFLFIYPDHNEALAKELKRLKIVKNRVLQKAMLTERNISERANNKAALKDKPRPMLSQQSFKITMSSLAHHKTIVSLDSNKDNIAEDGILHYLAADSARKLDATPEERTVHADLEEGK